MSATSDAPANENGDGITIASLSIEVGRRALIRRCAGGALLGGGAVFAQQLAAAMDFTQQHGSPLALTGSFVAWLSGACVLLRLHFLPIVAAPASTRKPGFVTVRGGAVLVQRDGVRAVYPVADVQEGWMEAYEKETRVVLLLRSGDTVNVLLDGAVAGHDLLVAAGVAPEQHVMKMRLTDGAAQIFGGGCLAVLATIVLSCAMLLAAVLFAVNVPKVGQGSVSWVDGTLVTGLVLAATGVAGIVALLRWVTPLLAIVGTDGVAVRGIARKEFYPYAAIESVETTDRGVRLRLGGERERTLATLHRGLSKRENNVPTAVLFQRIRDAMVAGKLGSSALAGASALDREGRPFADWLSHLQTLGVGERGYRNVALARDDIARVLEDASAPPGRRIAAALALAPAGDGETKQRIAVAVAGCAQDELRRAMQAALEGELDEEGYEAVVKRRQA